ncbi:anthranilate phosphoribosyltransferase [Actinopolymorpha singaporensis]|uniref:Anthranilate phosphoribosyltransferase n=1 Tax=Actinopolymorpha singaporensis TaxID=117157 RepID=A0A1H1L775_9ACTN|nr:anthranilate phosphoribosyltransferase [Actinopolymorpha singaporensis]
MDVLECLGLNLDLPVERVAQMAEEVGITFCFAPKFHPGLRHASPTRRELGVPTAFNVLAPLINPARPPHQLVGVAPSKMTRVVAGVLARRGGTALVVRGDDGMDKLTTTTTSQIWVVRDGQVGRRVQLDPRDLGIPQATQSDLRGGNARENATTVRRVLDGERGPVRDIVLLNAAAAIVAMNPTEECLSQDLTEALAHCAEAVNSGAAANVLARWIAAATTTSAPR